MARSPYMTRCRGNHWIYQSRQFCLFDLKKCSEIRWAPDHLIHWCLVSVAAARKARPGTRCSSQMKSVRYFHHPLMVHWSQIYPMELDSDLNGRVGRRNPHPISEVAMRTGDLMPCQVFSIGSTASISWSIATHRLREFETSANERIVEITGRLSLCVRVPPSETQHRKASTIFWRPLKLSSPWFETCLGWY